MTTQEQKALELALKALTDFLKAYYTGSVAIHCENAEKAICAIKEALANHIPDATKMVAQQSNEQVEPLAFDVWLEECEKMTMAIRHGVKFLLMPEDSAVRIGTAIQNTHPPVPTAQPKEPEQEPVMVIGENESMMCRTLPTGTKLYTTPPQRKPLTDEQIDTIIDVVEVACGFTHKAWDAADPREIVRVAINTANCIKE